MTYLPATSRTWYIHLQGKLQTQALIHAQTKDLECGMHYGHYIESDEILDDMSLELVEKDKELSTTQIVTQTTCLSIFLDYVDI